MNRVSNLLAAVILFFTFNSTAAVTLLVDDTSVQSRDSVHTYILETDNLIPSQWTAAIRHSCCIVSQVFGTNKVIVTASPEVLVQLANDLVELERLAGAGGDVTASVSRLAGFYSSSQPINITPQVSESKTFTITDSRVTMPVVNAVLTHFTQANMVTVDGRMELAVMAVNEAQIRQLLAAAVR